MAFNHLIIPALRLTAALLLCGSGVPKLTAQEVSEPGRNVAALIADLDSDDFRLRQQAMRVLEEIGEPAIGLLREQQGSGSPEQRLRAGLILDRIQRDSFSARLSDLETTPTGTMAARLPRWDQFSTLVDDDAEAISTFIRLMNAEPQLFAACHRDPGSVPAGLRSRVMELQEAHRPVPRPVKEPVETTDLAESLAAVLLIASDETVRLPGATSTTISNLLHSGALTEHLLQQDGESAAYRRLAGAWVLRKGIAPQTPLMIAQRFRLPEGPVLARRVLKTALRGTNGWYAMTLLAVQGQQEDLPLLESLIENHTVLFRSTKSVGENSYRVEICDVALAAALRLRGQDPRRFGFPDPEPGEPFTFTLDATGFPTSARRSAAVQQYRERFLSAEAATPPDK